MPAPQSQPTKTPEADLISWTKKQKEEPSKWHFTPLDTQLSSKDNTYHGYITSDPNPKEDDKGIEPEVGSEGYPLRNGRERRRKQKGYTVREDPCVHNAQGKGALGADKPSEAEGNEESEESGGALRAGG